MIVLDASVALKWIFGEEEGGEKAGITLYDAAYIVLARKSGCPFVTSDRSLYKKVKKLKELRKV